MGQNSQVRQSSYSKITTPLSEKESMQLHYNEISVNEIVANKKHERRLFVCQLSLMIIVVTLAFVKEIYFPGNIEWLNTLMHKLHLR